MVRRIELYLVVEQFMVGGSNLGGFSQHFSSSGLELIESPLFGDGDTLCRVWFLLWICSMATKTIFSSAFGECLYRSGFLVSSHLSRKFGLFTIPFSLADSSGRSWWSPYALVFHGLV